jgi:hypothetical protein
MSTKSANTANWTNITNYRNNFTPEEREAYNTYCVGRMKAYFNTPKGKEKQKENNKLQYQKRKAKKALIEERTLSLI